MLSLKVQGPQILSLSLVSGFIESSVFVEDRFLMVYFAHVTKSQCWILAGDSRSCVSVLNAQR